jgi:hypothetical protein
MRAKTFDTKVDRGEKITGQLDLSKARRIKAPVRRTVTVSNDSGVTMRPFGVRRGVKKGNLVK